MQPLILLALATLLSPASADGDPVCGAPGHCAGNNLVGFDSFPRDSDCHEECVALGDACSGYYYAKSEYDCWGCFLVGGCDFVPEHARTNRDAQFIYFDKECDLRDSVCE